jgi:anthraniloyl-CoA monooxygenase
MDAADREQVIEEYRRAVRRATRTGFDLLEVHMAHGYLLSSFLSPAANQRDDDFGGSLENRMRFPLQVFEAVRALWPEDCPLAVRISASDWLTGGEGTTIEDSVVLVRALRERGCDLIDVSSAGNTPRSEPEYGRMYQVPFAEQIRYAVGMPVMAVGAILGADHVNTILAAGRADLCALARPHLIDPALTLQAAIDTDNPDHPWPRPYLAARPSRWSGLDP